MTQRFRWTQRLADGRTVTVTRVVGDHELNEHERRRRYALNMPDDARIGQVGTADDISFSTPRDGPHALIATVPDGTGLARVRIATNEGRTQIHLPGPTFGEHCTAAMRDDQGAALAVLDAFDSAIEVPFVCGGFLGVDGVTTLLGALAGASGGAADDIHAARYNIVCGLVVAATGVEIGSASAFEDFVAGLDAIEDIGTVDPIDALGDVIATVHESEADTRAWLNDLGYDVPTLERRDDGRFFAYRLAKIAATDGFRAVERHVARRQSTGSADYERAKARAKNADYWERGQAWCDLVRPAVRRSLDEFGYVLANALYWTGEVSRTDARVDELLYEGAATVASEIGVEWIETRAEYERHRTAGHRHRSSRNHDLAIRHFGRAEEIATQYDFLDAWEPAYSQTVVRSNQLSTKDDHRGAVAAIEAGLEDLSGYDIPEERREEMVDHLEGQRRERLAILARDNDYESRIDHLKAAKTHYEAIGFNRSADRIASKLEDARRDSTDEGELEHDERRRSQTGRGSYPAVPQPRLTRRPDVGPRLEDIPDLHDYLTETDPDAVGSADPGVLPDERGGRPEDEPGWY